MGPGLSVECDGQLLEHYNLKEVIGRGASGVVYAIKHRQSKERKAAKLIDPRDTCLDDIVQEADLMKQVQHPTVARLHGLFSVKDFIGLVMDIYDGGTLADALTRHWTDRGRLPVHVIQSVVKMMVKATEWLHSHGIVHRDIKRDNFLVDRQEIIDPECRTYLTDFGFACVLEPQERLVEKVGTKTYWAPEVYRQSYSVAIDVWAVGTIMYLLAFQTFPFNNETEVRTRPLVCKGNVISAEGENLLQGMLSKDEQFRMTARAALEHGFVASVASADEAAEEAARVEVAEEEASAEAEARCEAALHEAAANARTNVQPLIELVPVAADRSECWQTLQSSTSSIERDCSLRGIVACPSFPVPAGPNYIGAWGKHPRTSSKDRDCSLRSMTTCPSFPVLAGPDYIGAREKDGGAARQLACRRLSPASLHKLTNGSGVRLEDAAVAAASRGNSPIDGCKLYKSKAASICEEGSPALHVSGSKCEPKANHVSPLVQVRGAAKGVLWTARKAVSVVRIQIAMREARAMTPPGPKDPHSLDRRLWPESDPHCHGGRRSQAVAGVRGSATTRASKLSDDGMMDNISSLLT